MQGRRAGSVVVLRRLGSFNSLFEMLLAMNVEAGRGYEDSFNSLFEMQDDVVVREGHSATQALSILYLRCTADFPFSPLYKCKMFFQFSI